MLELWSKRLATQPCVQRTRMRLVVRDDKALGPIDVGFLGPLAGAFSRAVSCQR
jgi:hypothetical protein